MPFIPENNKGRMFHQEEHEKRSKKSPDYSGTINIGGVLHRIVGWYNYPTEKVKVATISLRTELYSEYEQRRAAAKADRVDPNDHAPAIRPEDRQPARLDGPPQGDPDDDIPF